MFNDIIQAMKLTKSGSPDKRFRNQEPQQTTTSVEQTVEEPQTVPEEKTDPNDLLASFLEQNNIELTFDVVSGFIANESTAKRLKNQLVIKASYVTSR